MVYNKHNISNLKVYPQHHFYEATANTLNLYSNVEVNIGDVIKSPEGNFKVLEFKNLQDEDITVQGKNNAKTAKTETKSKFNKQGVPLIRPYLEEIIKHTNPSTLYYEIKLEAV